MAVFFKVKKEPGETGQESEAECKDGKHLVIISHGVSRKPQSN